MRFSEAEILNICRGSLKECDGGSLYHKFTNRRQAIVEGQGHFTQRVVPWRVLPAV